MHVSATNNPYPYPTPDRGTWFKQSLSLTSQDATHQHSRLVLET